MNHYEKMKELAEEMVNWFRSTYGDLFVDEMGTMMNQFATPPVSLAPWPLII